MSGRGSGRRPGRGSPERVWRVGLVESRDPNGHVAPTRYLFDLLATKGCRETVDGMVEKGAKDGEKRCGRNNFFPTVC